MSNRFQKALDALAIQIRKTNPSRCVSRRFRGWEVPNDELLAGVYTIVSLGVPDYDHLTSESMVDNAPLNIVVYFQIRLPQPTDPDSSVDPLSVEAAEFAAVDEIESLTHWDTILPDELKSLELKSFTQSAQVDVPEGWVEFQLTNRS